MKEASEATAKRPRRTLLEQLDEMLEEREGLESVIAKATAKRDKKKAKADKRFEKEVGKAPKKLEKLDQKLKAFLERHRYWLIRQNDSKKTITRPHGVVKEVLQRVELDKPGDLKPATDLLLSRRGGKRWLIVVYKLDLRKLLHAPPELKALLRPLGFRWSRHRTLSVTSPSSSGPTMLSRRPYNERS